MRRKLNMENKEEDDDEEEDEEENGGKCKIYIVYIEEKIYIERILVLFCNTLSMTKNNSAAFMQKSVCDIQKEQTNEYLSPEYIYPCIYTETIVK